MTTVLKLGGSLITDKERAETLDGAALDAAADAIAGCAGRLALVHGAGSFGHHYAEKHGVSVADGTEDAGAALEIHGSMTTLNRFVLSRLHGRDVSALPVHPLSAGARDADAMLQLATRYDNAWLGLHGQGITHLEKMIQTTGGERLLFGSDWPFYHLGASLAKVLIVTQSGGREELRERILRGNALSLFPELG